MADSEENFRIWMNSAKLDLEDFQCNFNRGENYRCLYFLQQATEKSAKAILLGMGLASEEKVSDYLDEFIFKTKTPKDYGHNWRKTFVNQLDAMRRSPLFSSFLSIFQEKGLSNPQTTVEKADSVKDSREPTLEDVQMTLDLCNELLDKVESAKSTQEMKDIAERWMPRIDDFIQYGREEVDIEGILQRANPMFEDLLSQRGIKLSRKFIDQFVETMKTFDLDPPSVSGNASDYFKKVFLLIHRLFPLGVLLVLSVLLNPCLEMRYPSKVNIYGLIPKLEDLKVLINRCIDMSEEVHVRIDL